MRYWGTGMGGWGMLLMTMSNLLFLGLLVAGAIALIRYTSRSARQDPAAQQAPAQRVLADRFALGRDRRRRVRNAPAGAEHRTRPSTGRLIAQISP